MLRQWELQVLQSGRTGPPNLEIAPETEQTSASAAAAFQAGLTYGTKGGDDIIGRL